MSGLLGKIITNGSTQQAAVVPSNITYASINILVVNPTALDAECTGWLANAGTAVPGNVDLIGPGDVIPVNGKLEWNCRIVSPGEIIFIKAPAGCVVRVESCDELLS